MITLTLLWVTAACHAIETIAITAAVEAAESVGALLPYAMQPRPAIAPAARLLATTNLLIALYLPIVVGSAMILARLSKRKRWSPADWPVSEIAVEAEPPRCHRIAA